jgi:peptidoglycan-associated lipoprotein
MSKMWKAFLTGLVIAAVVVIPACKPKKPPVVTPATVDTTPTGPPTVSIPPHDETTVAQPEPDFVTDTAPKVTDLPTDIDELNRLAQREGYVRDAFFDYDASTLSADAQSALSQSATWLKAHPNYSLLVEGHCDERGTEQYNLALGDRRANTAKEYLTTLGVDASRIRTVSYGEERPFDPGHDESAWAKNRRAHLVLVGK